MIVPTNSECFSVIFEEQLVAETKNISKEITMSV